MVTKTIVLVSESSTDKNVDVDAKSNNCVEKSYSAQKIRWLMLAIFICFTFINSVQWGQYVIISNLIQQYYGVSAGMVDNTTIVFMLAYIPLIFPALSLLQKMGIRFCLLLSCAGLSVGAWIKLIASFEKDLFFLVLLGQGVIAIFQVLAFGLAAKVAAVWFAANQVSFACALAVFGDQLGTAFGFIVPTVVVNGETEQSIQTGLIRLNLIIACFSSSILIAAFVLFMESPKSPPSAAQAVANQRTDNNMLESIIRVSKSKSFLAMMLAYGILVASFNSYIAVMNSVFFKYYPKAGEIQVGLISFLTMMSGIGGSILFGWLFDKTHMYKGLTLLLYVCAVIVTIANAFVPQQLVLELVYASNILIGFFLIAYYSVGIQLAIEITFPVSESLVSSLLLLASQCLGIPFTKLYRWLFDEYGYTYANAFISSALVIGCCLTAVIPAKLRRTSINTNHCSATRI